MPVIPLPIQPSLSPVTLPIDIPGLSLSPVSVSHDGDTLLATSCASQASSFDSIATTPSTASSCAEECCPAVPPIQSKRVPACIPESKYVPLTIVGAGPHALALAARLSEARPAALYTDLEHARLSWLRRGRHERGQSKKSRPSVKGHWPARKLMQPNETEPVPPGVIKVFDSTANRFMGRWDAFFANLSLETLRSPMTFHPAPADVDALVAFARRQGRESELMPIDGVVGAEFSKYQRKKNPKRTGRAPTINERERQDYFRPGTALFRDFLNEDLIQRYDLSAVVTQAEVTDVAYGPLHVQHQDVVEGFSVTIRDSQGNVEIFGAKAVVFAVGPSSRYNIPSAIASALPHDLDPLHEPALPWSRRSVQGEAWCHSAAFAMDGFTFLSERVRNRIAAGESATIVVIGGGLTSVQIVDLCVRLGVTRVVLVCRSRIKVKHFDFDLDWVSKYANVTKQAFWQEECRQTRFEMIREARNGGSVNPQYYRVLKSLLKSGDVELQESTEIQQAEYDTITKQWTLNTSSGIIENVDYVVCSTGSRLDFADLPCVRGLQQQYPIGIINGLPVLTTDLQWSQDIPAFVMGAYSMLELGPDALNLSGTRHGAERIAHRLTQMGVLRAEGDGVAEEDRFGAGESPFFSLLDERDA